MLSAKADVSASAPLLIGFPEETPMTWSAANLFGHILFGAIGLAAFVYGKKQSSFKAMLLGVAIMAYPYFVAETWVLYIIGGVLTLLLFVWRD